MARIDPDAALPSIEEPEETTQQTYPSCQAHENQRLVEIVLDRFRLSQQEWDECARQIGRQNGADIQRQWNNLMGAGQIGLRREE